MYRVIVRRLSGVASEHATTSNRMRGPIGPGTVASMISAEQLEFGQGVCFAFCCFDCASNFAIAWDVPERRVLFATLNASWCVSCAECGRLVYTHYSGGVTACPLCTGTGCADQRWELTRQAAQFALRYRRLATNSLGAAGAWVPIADRVWQQALSISTFMVDADGADIADVVWARQGGETPFG